MNPSLSQSPAQTLPSETLGAIARTAFYDLTPIERQNAKFAFGSVCRAWYLAVTGWSDYAVQTPSQVECLTAKLERERLERRSAPQDVGFQAPPPRSLSVTFGEGLNLKDSGSLDSLAKATWESIKRHHAPTCWGQIRELEVHYTPDWSYARQDGSLIDVLEFGFGPTPFHGVESLRLTGYRNSNLYHWKHWPRRLSRFALFQLGQSKPSKEMRGFWIPTPGVQTIEIACLEDCFSIEVLVSILAYHHRSLTSLKIGRHTDKTSTHLRLLLGACRDSVRLTHFSYDHIMSPNINTKQQDQRHIFPLLKELPYLEELAFGAVWATDRKLFAALRGLPKLRKLVLILRGDFRQARKVVIRLIAGLNSLSHLEIRLWRVDDEWEEEDLEAVRVAAKAAGVRFWYHGRMGLP